MTPELKTQIIVGTVGALIGLLIAVIGFLIKSILEGISKDITELKANAQHFGGFASRVETILAYHDKQITTAFTKLDNDRPRREF